MHPFKVLVFLMIMQRVIHGQKIYTCFFYNIKNSVVSTFNDQLFSETGPYIHVGEILRMHSNIPIKGKWLSEIMQVTRKYSIPLLNVNNIYIMSLLFMTLNIYKCPLTTISRPISLKLRDCSIS